MDENNVFFNFKLELPYLTLININKFDSKHFLICKEYNVQKLRLYLQVPDAINEMNSPFEIFLLTMI